MLGKNHIIANSMIMTTVVMGAGAAAEMDSIGDAGNRTLEYLFDPGLLNQMGAIPYIVVTALLLFLGSVLPDIDSKTSIIGRYVHLPVKHRTWTHSIWMIIAFYILSKSNPIFRYLFIGVALHLILDSFSNAGICWLYPFEDYKRFKNGAFVAPGHKLKCYCSGDSSEMIFLGVIFVVCAILISVLGYKYALGARYVGKMLGGIKL